MCFLRGSLMSEAKIKQRRFTSSINSPNGRSSIITHKCITSWIKPYSRSLDQEQGIRQHRDPTRITMQMGLSGIRDALLELPVPPRHHLPLLSLIAHAPLLSFRQTKLSFTNNIFYFFSLRDRLSASNRDLHIEKENRPCATL